MQERGRVLARWSDLISENQDVATIICLDSGKPKDESTREVNYAMSFINFYAGIQTSGMVLSQQTANHMPHAADHQGGEPVGVCALLIPWNFPATMFTRKVAPALMAGCTVVLKPELQSFVGIFLLAENIPLTALALAWLWERAGGPKGVANVLPTPRELVQEVGNVLTTDEAVKKISSTRSTAVGKQLLKHAAGTVFDDANRDMAVSGAKSAKFCFGGQVCIARNRFLVQEGIYDAFIERIVQRFRAPRVGDGLD